CNQQKGHGRTNLSDTMQSDKSKAKTRTFQMMSDEVTTSSGASNANRKVSPPNPSQRAKRVRLVPLNPLDMTGASSQKTALALIGALSTIIVIGAWWALTGSNGPIPDLYFASPPEVVKAAVTYMTEPYQGSTVYGHAISSLKTVLLG